MLYVRFYMMTIDITKCQKMLNTFWDYIITYSLAIGVVLVVPLPLQSQPLKAEADVFFLALTSP